MKRILSILFLSLLAIMTVQKTVAYPVISNNGTLPLTVAWIYNNGNLVILNQGNISAGQSLAASSSSYNVTPAIQISGSWYYLTTSGGPSAVAFTPGGSATTSVNLGYNWVYSGNVASQYSALFFSPSGSGSVSISPQLFNSNPTWYNSIPGYSYVGAQVVLTCPAIENINVAVLVCDKFVDPNNINFIGGININNTGLDHFQIGMTNITTTQSFSFVPLVPNYDYTNGFVLVCEQETTFQNGNLINGWRPVWAAKIPTLAYTNGQFVGFVNIGCSTNSVATAYQQPQTGTASVSGVLSTSSTTATNSQLGTFVQQGGVGADPTSGAPLVSNSNSNTIPSLLAGILQQVTQAANDLNKLSGAGGNNGNTNSYTYNNGGTMTQNNPGGSGNTINNGNTNSTPSSGYSTNILSLTNYMTQSSFDSFSTNLFDLSQTNDLNGLSFDTNGLLGGVDQPSDSDITNAIYGSGQWEYMGPTNQADTDTKSAADMYGSGTNAEDVIQTIRNGITDFSANMDDTYPPVDMTLPGSVWGFSSQQSVLQGFGSQSDGTIDFDPLHTTWGQALFATAKSLFAWLICLYYLKTITEDGIRVVMIINQAHGANPGSVSSSWRNKK